MIPENHTGDTSEQGAEPGSKTTVHKRRTFTAAEKHRILRELDSCRRGEACAIYRREGIYASTVAVWRKELALALAPRKRGPKPAEDATLRAEIRRLRRRIQELERRLQQQKKITRSRSDVPEGGIASEVEIPS